jgi:2-amino-4-hydroxy-6-hydroxymethyldihydropteridine diphosphokinase
MSRAYIAFGGNVGDARETIARAIAQFCDGARVRLKARSSDYKTPPWGVTDQPPFINACIAIETELSPHDLLARAHEVERAFGRNRAQELHWGPRPLDIDILACDDLSMDEAGLVLPHPRLFERAFVLVPLDEIAPGAVVAGRSLREALAKLDRDGIERLETKDT